MPEILSMGYLFTTFALSNFMILVMEIFYKTGGLHSSHTTTSCVESLELLPREVRQKISHIDDIVYIQAQSNYSYIYIKGNGKIFVSKTLKSLSAMLNEAQFVRIHQSYCINRKYLITIIRKKQLHLLLHGNIILPVSRSKKYLFNIKYNPSCINASFL